MNRETLKSIPKVELHRHLDGSVRFETILDLARINNLDLGSTDKDVLWKRSKVLHPLSDLNSVLAVFETTAMVLCNYNAIKRVTFENVEDCYNDGCKLAELRFAPTYMTEGKDLTTYDVLTAVTDGVAEAVSKFDIEVGLIFIVPRSFDLEKNRQATQDLTDFLSSKHGNAHYIVGFDLADAECSTIKDDFVPLVDQARAAGLGITIHSGEDTNGQHVIESIEKYRPQRIGHGIQIWQNKDAMDLVKEKNVLLEVCPISNWLTSSVSNLEEHPLPELLKAGVPVCLNSDDPHIMNISLVDEYENAVKNYGFSDPEFKKMNQSALEHSFVKNPSLKL